MRMTDQQIVEILKRYVGDKRHHQAILIDGDWGSGKTYFVKKQLMPELKKLDSKQPVYYVSLYGLNSINQITDEIYSVFFEEFIDKIPIRGADRIAAKGANIAAKLFSTALASFTPVDTDKLPKFSDFKAIEKSIIIFDDLERCDIDINQLLGFINNLVEHNEIKTVLVANQRELGKTNFANDLSQKYTVALNPCLALPLEEKDATEKNDITKGITREQLIKRTEQIFQGDVLYRRIKEKLVGLTIQYQADLKSIFESLILEYVNDEKARNYLLSKKQVILGIFEERYHFNIRTLIFAVMAYEAFFEILSKLKFSSEYLEWQKDNILKYTVALSIHIKTGERPIAWGDREVGMIPIGSSALGGKIFGYRFVDSYLLHHYLNADEIIDTVMLLMEERKATEDSIKAEMSLAYQPMMRWWEFEDEELCTLMLQIKDDLTMLKYPPGYFGDIILMLLQLENYNFKFPNCSPEDFIQLMNLKIEQSDIAVEGNTLNIIGGTPTFQKRYNELCKPLFESLKAKCQLNNSKFYSFINEEWNDLFVEKCREHYSLFLEQKKFIFYLDPLIVEKKLGQAKVKDIYAFLGGIEKVYDHSNLDEHFQDDILNLRKLLEIVNDAILGVDSCTKKISLERLKLKLKNSIKIIERVNAS